MERRIDHPLGAMSGQSFLELRVFDITLHAWDLARSIGVDEELAPPLVDLVLEVIEARPRGWASESRRSDGCARPHHRKRDFSISPVAARTRQQRLTVEIPP